MFHLKATIFWNYWEWWPKNLTFWDATKLWLKLKAKMKTVLEFHSFHLIFDTVRCNQYHWKAILRSKTGLFWAYIDHLKSAAAHFLKILCCRKKDRSFKRGNVCSCRPKACKAPPNFHHVYWVFLLEHIRCIAFHMHNYKIPNISSCCQRYQRLSMWTKADWNSKGLWLWNLALRINVFTNGNIANES